MTTPAFDIRRPPAEPVFLNFRSEVVRPVCFAVVYWYGPGDTIYAFEDRIAFERQRATAERHCVHVRELSAEQAANWIAAGRKALLYELSVSGAAGFVNLKLAPG